MKKFLAITLLCLVGIFGAQSYKQSIDKELQEMRMRHDILAEFYNAKVINLHRNINDFRNFYEVPQSTIFAQYRVKWYIPDTPEMAWIRMFGTTAVELGTAVGIHYKDADGNFNRTLITAAHLFDEGVNAEDCVLELFDENTGAPKGEEKKFTLVRQGNTLNWDLAHLHVDFDLPHVVHLEDKDAVENMKIGSSVYVVGASHGASPYNVTFGLLSAKMFKKPLEGLIQTSVSVAGGNSGGGVYTRSTHKLIGVLVRGAVPSSLFVPIDRIYSFLEGKEIPKEEMLVIENEEESPEQPPNE